LKETLLRPLVRCAAATLITVLSGCAAGHGSAPAASSLTPVKATANPATAGPLGILPIPADAQAGPRNTGKPLSLDAFVQGFFVKSAWTSEEGRFKQRGFVSGAIEAWINSNGSEQSIVIAKFAAQQGAASLFEGVTSVLVAKPSPATVINDAADGGVGTVSPTLDADGNAIAEIAAYTGGYFIDVHEFTAATPNPDAAKALLLRQYNSLIQASSKRLS
jgi:hypothetical protein